MSAMRGSGDPDLNVYIQYAFTQQAICVQSICLQSEYIYATSKMCMIYMCTVSIHLHHNQYVYNLNVYSHYASASKSKLKNAVQYRL